MADNSLIVNVGTALTMADDDIGGVHYPRVKVSLGADGAAADWTGNIPSGTVTLLQAGTITALAKGTISAGTIDAGTVLTVGLRHPDEFATVISSGTSVMGTVKAAVSGSAIYVTSMVISVGTASNVVIASGGTSTPIVGSLFLNTNGGAVLAPMDPPIRTASGSALVYKQSVDGPLTITATGYVD